MTSLCGCWLGSRPDSLGFVRPTVRPHDRGLGRLTACGARSIGLKRKGVIMSRMSTAHIATRSGGLRRSRVRKLHVPSSAVCPCPPDVYRAPGAHGQVCLRDLTLSSARPAPDQCARRQKAAEPQDFEWGRATYAAHARANARVCSLGNEPDATSSRVCLPPSSLTNESSQ